MAIVRIPKTGKGAKVGAASVKPNPVVPPDESKVQPDDKLSRAYSRFYSLPEPLLAKLEEMILSSKSGNEVAHILQNEWQVFTDVSPVGLAKQLTRYRNDLLEIRKLADPKTKKVTKDIRKQAQDTLKRINSRIDVLDSMESLVIMQWARVQKLHLLEKDMPMTLGSLSKEIQVMASLLDKTGNLQMDLGVIRKIDPRLKVQFELPAEIQRHEARMTTTRTMQEAAIKALNFLNGVDVPSEPVEVMPEPLDGEVQS